MKKEYIYSKENKQKMFWQLTIFFFLGITFLDILIYGFPLGSFKVTSNIISAFLFGWILTWWSYRGKKLK